MSERTSSDQWVAVHADTLYRYAVSRVGDPSVAEDLVQDSLLAALEGRRSFRGDSQERTWLIGILRHKVVDHFRAVGRRRETPLPLSGDDDSAADALFDGKGRWRSPPRTWELDGGQLLERREFWQVFHDCLRGLPDRPREAFTLRVVDQRNAGEVCGILGMTATNLWVALHRARTGLRQCLEGRWFTDTRPPRDGGTDENAQL